MWLPLMHPPLGTGPTTQACAQAGNRTGDSLVHRLALNPLNHPSQGELYTLNVWIVWCVNSTSIKLLPHTHTLFLMEFFEILVF